jgi:hypothetical protein
MFPELKTFQEVGSVDTTSADDGATKDFVGKCYLVKGVCIHQ